jgi:hypothetical protein
MSDPNVVEQDLREYLEKEKNLHKQDKLEYLRIMFNKHLSLNKLNHMVTKNDLFGIQSEAKKEYSQLTLPMFVTGRSVDSSELPSIAMIEAVVSYLNKNHLLKRLPKIDYTDASGEYDTLEE